MTLCTSALNDQSAAILESNDQLHCTSSLDRRPPSLMLVPPMYSCRVVSNEHANFAYKGLFGSPRLIATTDPLPYSDRHVVNGIYGTKRPRRIEVCFWNAELAVLLEATLASRLIKIMLSYRAESPMLTAIRAKYEGCTASPIIVLIFVREGTLSREDGALAVQDCLEVLQNFGICKRLSISPGMLVEICEGELEEHSSLYDLGLETDPRKDISGFFCSTLTGSPLIADAPNRNDSYVTAGPLILDLETNDLGVISVQHSLCSSELPYSVWNQQKVTGEPPGVSLLKTASQLYDRQELIGEIVACKQEIELQVDTRRVAEHKLQKYLKEPKNPKLALPGYTLANPAEIGAIDFLMFQNQVLNDLYGNLKRFESLLSNAENSAGNASHIGYVCFAPGIGQYSLYMDGFYHDFCVSQVVATQDTERLLKSAQLIDLGPEYDAHEVFRTYQHKGLQLSQLPKDRLLEQTGTYWTEADFMKLDSQSEVDDLQQEPFFFKAAAKSGFSMLRMLRFPIFQSHEFTGEVSKSMVLVSLDQKDASQPGDSGTGVYDLQGRSVCLIQGGMKKNQLIVAQPMFSIMGIINREKPRVRLYGSHNQKPSDTQGYT